jgi:hypothetical protein
MGASQSVSVSKPVRSILIERMIDGNAEKTVRIGISNHAHSPMYPFQNQCISVNNEPPKLLQHFEESGKMLKYTFEDNIQLSISKRDNNDVYYFLKTGDYECSRVIDPIVRKFFKPLGVGSPCELDKIDGLFKEQL